MITYLGLKTIDGLTVPPLKEEKDLQRIIGELKVAKTIDLVLTTVEHNIMPRFAFETRSRTRSSSAVGMVG